MDRGSALPKYLQVSEMLIRQIAAGHLPDGSRLPPERIMARDLGLSVGTLRKALAELQEQGLLIRIQGSGNYVRAQSDPAGLYALFRLERPGGGGLPSADLLGVERVAKPEAVRVLGSAPEAHRIRRLRRLDGVPVALEEIWLDGRFAQKIDAAALSESLYLFYQRALGLVIDRIEDRIGLGTAPDWSAPGFGVAPGAACGYVERLAHDATGAAVEYSGTWFDPAQATYVSRLGQGKRK